MSALPKLAHPVPANDAPQLRTMESVAAEFGFKHARAVRDWCKRRGVPYTRDGKFNWVDVNLLRAAIARGRVVVPSPAEPSIGQWVRSTVEGPRGT